MIDDRAYTVEEASELTGCAEEYLLRKIESGELLATGDGLSVPYRIPEDELRRWWQKRGGGALKKDSPLRSILTEFSDRLRDAETAEDLQQVEQLIAEKLERSHRSHPKRNARTP